MESRDRVRDEMLALAERLDELDDEQWNAASLCPEWRVRDVLAHMVAGAEGVFGPAAVFGGMLRHGFRFNRWVAIDGQRRGTEDPQRILAAFRAAAANREAVSAGASVTSLMHVVIHGQDICRPLGIARDIPEADLVAVADFVRDDRHRFGTKKRIAGLRLEATDADWSCGHGPEVVGPAEALVMMMAGRSVALHDLSGAGMGALAARR